MVSETEWGELRKPFPELRGLLPRHVDVPGLRWRRVQFERTDDASLAPFSRAHDLLGDGSLVLLPTPGHTPGSVSLLVRREGVAPVLLVGDLTYEVEVLERGRIPGVGQRAQLHASSALVRGLQQRLPGLAILAAHDPGAAARLACANAEHGGGGRGSR
jgi:glyoxylase-like metal-dependent hydrolase (beta-lactamase superfamily II)